MKLLAEHRFFFRKPLENRVANKFCFTPTGTKITGN